MIERHNCTARERRRQVLYDYLAGPWTIKSDDEHEACHEAIATFFRPIRELVEFVPDTVLPS